jgi:hypothetical protein
MTVNELPQPWNMAMGETRVVVRARSGRSMRAIPRAGTWY